MNRLQCYPVPAGAGLNENYKVRVRPVDSDRWQELATYAVKVDMHDVQVASMAYFDFEGSVEVEVSGPFYIYQVDVRPISKNIKATCDTKTVRFTLDQPANLSIEVNKDRVHNLHLFAGVIEEHIPDKEDENVLVVKGNLTRPNFCSRGELLQKLESMPKGSTVYFEPGIYYITESTMRLPSNINIYLSGGTILVGAFICSEVENIRIYGKGIFYLANFERYGGINGVRLSHAKNIVIEDVIFINPPHYTVYIGGSENVHIKNIKSFSCEGWSDGIDMMSSKRVTIENAFLRNSDDCIAVYGSRWAYHGGSSEVYVKGVTLWADVAHPIMVGVHGDYENEGDLIEDIHFEDIDILEHNEYQANYLGCMAINVGDKNTARNISFENIRVEPFKHGKLLDIQVKYNPDYNPAPGRSIEQIKFKDIYYTGTGEVTSQIKGYSEEYFVKGVEFENILINGQKASSAKEINLEIDEFASEIKFCE